MDSRLDLAPDFGRYSAAIRRLWWLIVLLTLLTAVPVAFVAGGDSGLTAEFSVTKLDKEIFSDFGDVSPQLTIEAQKVELDADQTRAELVKSNPAIGGVEISSNAIAGTISVRAAGSRVDALATIDAYETELRAIRRRALENAVSVPVLVGEGYLADLATSIDGLEASTLGGSGATTVETTVAVLERTELIRRRAEDSRTLEVLKSLPDAAESGVRRLEVRTSPDSTAPRAVLAGLGAAVLAALGIAIAAFFDRRVRRATDVDRVLGPNSTLAAIERNTPAPQLAALAAALRHKIPGGGHIQFIGVGGYDASALTETLNNARLLPDTFEVTPVPGVDVNSRAVESAVDAGTNVLVARVGGASESELASAAFAIHRAGGEVGGVVLAEAKRSVSSLLS